MNGETGQVSTLRVFRLRLFLLGLLAIPAGVALWSLPPLPQSLAYHDFADQRTILGIPHFLNVISNAAFVLVGAMGLSHLLTSQSQLNGTMPERRLRLPYAVFFLGVLVAGFGSTYYHLHPDNDRLLWDRLPISVAFMGLVTAVVAERIDVRLASLLLGPLVAAGTASVVYWHWTEQMGRGDLRPYYFVQFFPLLALPLILALFPTRYSGTADLVVALALYALAKVCEHPGDGPIFALGGWISGHTLKHLLAAASAFWVLRMLQKRQQPATQISM